MRDHGSRCGRRSCGFAAVEGIVGVADSRQSGGVLESAAEQAAAADRLSFSILLLGSSLGRPLSRAVRRRRGPMKRRVLVAIVAATGLLVGVSLYASRGGDGGRAPAKRIAFGSDTTDLWPSSRSWAWN